jgi:tryptophanyl-tRNA synthetase
MATSDTDASSAKSTRLLTGDRPTGPLHLGHLVGTLQARVELQDQHECFLIVADLHTLTTRPERHHVERLQTHVRDVVLDLLSVGIDHERTTIYLQSGVPAVYDLAVLLQNLVPASRLGDFTSLHEMARVAGVQPGEMSMGLLGYPVLQAADILMARAEVIPVGGDNVAHVELARELAATFNRTYGEVFPLPMAKTTRTPALPGVDGQGKMSKSADNAIFLKDSPEDVAAKVGRLEGDALAGFVQAFVEDPAERGALLDAWRSGGLGDAQLRARVHQEVERVLAPIRERRARFAGESGLVEEILVDGTLRARELAYVTLASVREAMGLEQLWKGLVGATERRAEARKRPY